MPSHFWWFFYFNKYRRIPLFFKLLFRIISKPPHILTAGTRNSHQRLRKQDSNVPTVIILDECQEFMFGPDNYTTKLLREGRKYGISGWFASQWISDKDTLAALEQAALRACFRPEPSNTHALARP